MTDDKRKSAGNGTLGPLVGLGIAVLVDVTEPLCMPFLLVGAALYCAVAIPLALIYGGWVLARDRFTKANQVLDK